MLRVRSPRIAVVMGADLSGTLSDATLVASGQTDQQATLSATLEDATLYASTLQQNLNLNVTLDNTTSNSTTYLDQEEDINSMGTLTSAHKKYLYDEIISNVVDETSTYYAFASNPVYVSNVESLTSKDFDLYQNPDLNMIFGKRLTESNFMPVIKKIIWTYGATYAAYDNTKDITKSLFYVISNPVTTGGNYNIFKCIDNNNNSPSTVDPGSITIQASTIQTSDGYKWRYVSSISTELYNKFSTEFFVPVTSNSTVQTTAYSLSKIEKIVVSNSGSGYVAYHSGKLGGYINSTAVYLAGNASSTSSFYTNNAIYIYDSSNNYQLFTIMDHYISLDKKIVILSESANLTLVSSDTANYIISPKVTIQSDSPTTDIPTAYSVINSTSNSISSIIVLNSGSYVSRANLSISSNYGTGATGYCVVPPSGGHGANPSVELNMVGMSVNFTFSNTENSTIPTNIQYNKIGIIKNPYYMNANTYYKSNVLYESNTFNQILSGNTTSAFTVGDVVYGANSKAKATVSWANNSYVNLIGDYNFISGESLNNESGVPISTITVQKRPDIFAKTMYPIYINNINNIARSNTQSETHKLIIKL